MKKLYGVALLSLLLLDKLFCPPTFKGGMAGARARSAQFTDDQKRQMNENARIAAINKHATKSSQVLQPMKLTQEDMNLLEEHPEIIFIESALVGYSNYLEKNFETKLSAVFNNPQIPATIQSGIESIYEKSIISAEAIINIATDQPEVDLLFSTINNKFSFKGFLNSEYEKPMWFGLRSYKTTAAEELKTFEQKIFKKTGFNINPNSINLKNAIAAMLYFKTIDQFVKSPEVKKLSLLSNDLLELLSNINPVIKKSIKTELYELEKSIGKTKRNWKKIGIWTTGLSALGTYGLLAYKKGSFKVDWSDLKSEATNAYEYSKGTLNKAYNWGSSIFKKAPKTVKA